MKAKELRIGNLVDVLGDPVFISYHDLIKLSKGIKTSMQPIPLTESWLLKFGFDEDGGYYGSYMLWFEKPFTHAFLNADILGEIKFPCKYVHQLQNLYFALTGEELTIK